MHFWSLRHDHPIHAGGHPGPTGAAPLHQPGPGKSPGRSTHFPRHSGCLRPAERPSPSGPVPGGQAGAEYGSALSDLRETHRHLSDRCRCHFRRPNPGLPSGLSPNFVCTVITSELSAGQLCFHHPRKEHPHAHHR